jgi:hypothetical protein
VLNPSTGQTEGQFYLAQEGVLDYETASSYTGELNVTDRLGLSATQSVPRE